MQDLTVALAQGDLRWESPAENRDYFQAMVEASQQPLDLVVLPEMFNSGFSMNASENAETMDGTTVSWMQTLADISNAAIVGSLAIAAGGKVMNRLVFARPGQALIHYDKRHLFRMADEHERYGAGNSRIIVEWRGWRICPLVCYDLRFPVWCRNREEYDLMLFVANWPRARRMHWRQLLVARAIENLSAVIGVNRVGTDGNDVSYSGDSLAIDALGRLIIDAGSQEGLHTCKLSGEDLLAYREAFPAFMDADDFTLAP